MQAPADPILGVSEAFRADKSELKLNLGVGAYRTEEIKPYVLNVVKKVGRVCSADCQPEQDSSIPACAGREGHLGKEREQGGARAEGHANVQRTAAPQALFMLQYLPIEGLAAFRKATVELLLGADHPAITEVPLSAVHWQDLQAAEACRHRGYCSQERVAVVQSLSGTGSLRLAAAFINKVRSGAPAAL